MSQSVDYRRLGEVTGKAWRLGHTGADKSYSDIESLRAANKLRIEETSEKNRFLQGWDAGVAAVDKERGRAKRRGLT